MPVRKIKAGYANLTSKVPSTKLNRSVSAESSLERDFYVLLDNDENIEHFEEQPFTIEGIGTIYTPDVVAHFSNGSSVIYEVKYRSELYKHWKKLKPKFKSAIKFGKDNGYQFKIVTEQEIRTTKLKNIKFITHFLRTVSQTEDATRQVLAKTLIDFHSASPLELLAASFSCKTKRAEAAPVLWRMIADGWVEVDLDYPLTMHTQLSISNEIMEVL